MAQHTQVSPHPNSDYFSKQCIGVSWVTTNKTSDDIVIVTRWPNHRDQAWKTPSTIAYASENPKIQRNHWGFEVTRGHKQYAWTKLLLDKSVDLTEHDDPLLRKMYGAEGFLGLPAGKTAKEVVQDYLAEVYKHTMSVLERELSAEVLATLPMECWVSACDEAENLILMSIAGDNAGDLV